MKTREYKAYRMYKASNNYSLYDVYGRFSKAKSEAWKYCKELCEYKNGNNLKIITANNFQFTAGFEYEETGKLMFMYITKLYDTECEVDV